MFLASCIYKLLLCTVLKLPMTLEKEHIEVNGALSQLEGHSSDKK